uniref:Crossover junction endodeoxyribonuclease RuvC n=1 Tax=Lygus hesperus TaxID=30085 RepID=A0A0A9WAW4_LYGHE
MWVWGLLLTAVLQCNSIWFNPAWQQLSFDVYRSSLNHRVDYISKELTKTHLNTGISLTEEVKNHVKKLSAPDDVIGVILNENLGGYGNETFNAIPMNPATEEIWRLKVMNPVYNFLSTNESWEKLTFEFLPVYEFDNSTRSSGFGVAIVVNAYDNEFYILKGYIPNPPKAKISDRIIPYLYSTSPISSGTGLETYEFGIAADQPPYSKRVEKACKYLLNDDIQRGMNSSETEEIAGFHPDVPGLLISKRFNAGNSTYNVVPMDQKAVEEFKTRVESPIIAYYTDPANSPNIVRVDVHVLYGDRVSIRPVGFLVHTRKPEKGLAVSNLYIPNQTSSKL